MYSEDNDRFFLEFGVYCDTPVELKKWFWLVVEINGLTSMVALYSSVTVSRSLKTSLSKNQIKN